MEKLFFFVIKRKLKSFTIENDDGWVQKNIN